jgi:hypothetical protein
MTRLLLLLLLVCVGCFEADAGTVIQVITAAGGSCDDCSGNLVIAIHFEDNADPTHIDDPTDDPCGCTDGTDDYADFIGGSGISSCPTFCSDGSHGMHSLTENDRLELDATGIAAGVSSVGTWCADYYYPASSESGRAFDIGPFGAIVGGVGADDTTLRMYMGSDFYSGTDTISDATWTRICFAWDESQGAGLDCLATQVEGNAWEASCTETLTDPTLSDPLSIVGDNGQYGRGYLDHVDLYAIYQAEDNL